MSYVDRDVVDAILHGALAEGGEHFGHLVTVLGGYFFRLQAQLLARLEVDEKMGLGTVVKINLVGHVVGMENDNFVLVVTEVPQGIEEFLKLRVFSCVS